MLARKHLWLALSLGIVFTAFLVFTCSALGAQGSQSAPAHYQKMLVDSRSTVESWGTQGAIQLSLTVAVIVFGATITVLQGYRKSWCKGVTITLGLATSIATGVSAKIFGGDYRTLRRSAIEARKTLRHMESMLDTYDPTQSGANIKSWETEFLKTADEIDDLEKKLLAELRFCSDGCIPQVFAEQKGNPPEWITSPPSDNRTLYFVGTAKDPLLDMAKTNSLEDGIGRAAEEIRRRNHGNPQSIKDFVRKASTIEDTSFSYDATARSYTYYTLLRISRQIEKVDFSSRYLLNLNVIKIKHDGAPGSTKWRFDIFLNKQLIAQLPFRTFGRHEKLIVTDSANGIAWVPVELPAAQPFDIEIKGYRPNSIAASHGEKHFEWDHDLTRKEIEVHVVNKPSLLGEFTFEFKVSHIDGP